MDPLTDLVSARRLLLTTRYLEAKRSGKKEAIQEARQALEADQAEAVSGTPESKPAQRARLAAVTQTEQVRLADLVQNLKPSGNAAQTGACEEKIQSQVTVVQRQTVDVELELRYASQAPVQGLVVHNRNLAESDRYLFLFRDGATLTITDKWAGKSTTIWGDPHIDTSDEEGENNGDFKDLTQSDTHTTFMLADGSRVTITAQDNGVIEYVDLFKESQHVRGTGAGAKDYGEGQQDLFDTRVDGQGARQAAAIPTGDVVYAGGDGNDWFDSANRLVWGRTTGPANVSRPAASLEVYARQTVSSEIFIQRVDWRS
ncbi:MAG: DUF1521 domain-containing protein [Chloroflexi bacterium]|nr:DUF1521 domain-containing protein [Chloroflexota bacterium]